jgi:hypothetical protein
MCTFTCQLMNLILWLGVGAKSCHDSEQLIDVCILLLDLSSRKIQNINSRARARARVCVCVCGNNHTVLTACIHTVPIISKYHKYEHEVFSQEKNIFIVEHCFMSRSYVDYQISFVLANMIWVIQWRRRSCWTPSMTV